MTVTLPEWAEGEGYLDQTSFLDLDEADIPAPTQIGQEIWRDYVNDLGPADDTMLQVNFMDNTFDELFEAAYAPDSDSAGLDLLLEQEFAATEQDVPFEWQYWLHEPTTVPDVDESNAPPLPSGWVDPDTDEVIP